MRYHFGTTAANDPELRPPSAFSAAAADEVDAVAPPACAAAFAAAPEDEPRFCCSCCCVVVLSAAIAASSVIGLGGLGKEAEGKRVDRRFAAHGHVVPASASLSPRSSVPVCAS
eukprot:366568-Chlamydomonas_euryale.AAC.14